MEDSPSELVASNQQNQNQNGGQYVSCNICQRAFEINRGLLQHSLCRKRNRENNINSNNAINGSDNTAEANDKSDSHESSGNGDHGT